MYHFPFYESNLSISTKKTMIQFVFRVKVVDINNIYLLCKPSTTSNEFTVFDTTSKKNLKKSLVSTEQNIEMILQKVIYPTPIIILMLNLFQSTL